MTSLLIAQFDWIGSPLVPLQPLLLFLQVQSYATNPSLFISSITANLVQPFTSIRPPSKICLPVQHIGQDHGPRIQTQRAFCSGLEEWREARGRGRGHRRWQGSTGETWGQDSCYELQLYTLRSAIEEWCSYPGGKTNLRLAWRYGRFRLRKRICTDSHIACFNVETGDVEDAPALDPLAKFDITEKNEGVYIKGEEATIKASRRSASHKCSTSGQESVVVVGG